MIKYDYFSRREAIEWQHANPISPEDPLSDIHTNWYEFCDMDQLVGIGAWDGDRVIGRNLFFHIPILVNGSAVECIVTNNLMVAPEYRPKGVGTYLKMYVLKLGYPQISSGVSPAMQKVYDAWSAYCRVDASPTYSVPVSAFGLLRITRLAVESSSGSGQKQASRLAVGATMMSRRRSVYQLAKEYKRSGATLLSCDEAKSSLHALLNSYRPTVQVPWNMSILMQGLHGRHPRLHAWVLDLPSGTQRMITGYLARRSVRTIGTRTGRITEMLLNEIWPPVYSKEEARICLAFAVLRARALGISILQVDAMTEALRQVCRDAGFDSFYRKRVYIAPNTKNSDLRTTLSDPNSWWCRAINENEFEEVALSRAGALEQESFVPRVSVCAP